MIFGNTQPYRLFFLGDLSRYGKDNVEWESLKVWVFDFSWGWRGKWSKDEMKPYAGKTMCQNIKLQPYVPFPSPPNMRKSPSNSSRYTYWQDDWFSSFLVELRLVFVEKTPGFFMEFLKHRVFCSRWTSRFFDGNLGDSHNFGPDAIFEAEHHLGCEIQK